MRAIVGRSAFSRFPARFDKSCANQFSTAMANGRFRAFIESREHQSIAASFGLSLS
jgi:hypothetical protein